ncbi:SAM-dependent methyltransferase [Streptomyces sp. NPDC049954]|uniref:SAM-dependent methyltransferase n=1 Tax=Streptomyces sp. NPDC049954 TaxID=3155779 RepID=UPI00341AF909
MSDTSGPARTADKEGQAAGTAHNARVWNHWLGGKDHYLVDERVGDSITAMYPSIGEVARADRAFLRRAVTHLTAEAGLRQFLDIGTGLPSADNTHEVAQRTAPEARVVYVDNDPMVLTHARALLAGAPEGVTRYIDADAREPEAILEQAASSLDLGRPVALMLLGILNFVPDTDEARRIVRTLLDALAPGSHLVLTHPTLELGGAGNIEAMAFWNEHATPPITARTGAEIASFAEGLELLPPGLVSCVHWRPEPTPDGTPPRQVAQYGLVARKS